MKTKRMSKRFGYAVLCSIFLLPAIVSAQSSSNSYKVEESLFGTGGNVDTSSASYRARQSAGILAAGDMSSPLYRAAAGFVTPSEPFLEAGIAGPDLDLGTLSPSAPSYGSPQGGSCNCTFYVRAYLSSGYTVITGSDPPTSENGDDINAKAAQGAASTDSSVEEFGINLVANTNPGSMGALPQNVPDDEFADGVVATGYQTANQFKYGVGDIIATAPGTSGNQGIGQTNYTISYIMKPSNLTPAGTYQMRHNIIVVATF